MKQELVHKIRNELLDRFWDLCANTFLASHFMPSKIRVAVLRLLGLRIGKAKIFGGGYFGRGRITIGYGAGINQGAYFEPGAPIVIGNQVMFGPNVSLITTTHPVGATEIERTRRFGTDMIQKPIRIGDNVWLGLGVTVLPGVRIGNGAVVAAQSLVTEDVLPNTLVAGTPARKIRDLPVG